jgi:hypothetical protein
MRFLFARKKWLFLGFVLFTGIPVQAKEHSWLDQFAFLIQFPIPHIRIVSHELSHALAAKALVGSRINMHFGVSPDQVSAADIEAGTGFRIHGLAPEGFASCYSDGNRVKDILITLAGPLGGILSIVVMRKVLQKYLLDNAKKKNKYLSEWGLLLDSYAVMWMIGELVYGFTPLYQGPSGDGYRLWQMLGCPKKYLDRLSSFDSTYKIGLGMVQVGAALLVFCGHVNDMQAVVPGKAYQAKEYNK